MSRRTSLVDHHIGERLSWRRRSLGMSQSALGAGLGVTFQQVQKYESGMNRMAASTLYEAAKVLGVPVTYFFDGIEGDDRCGVEPPGAQSTGGH